MNTFDTIFADEPVTMALREAGAGYSIPEPVVEDRGYAFEIRHAETLPAGYYPDQATEEPATMPNQEGGEKIPAAIRKRS